jgi:DNA-binding MarR family transcriptional regulator
VLARATLTTLIDSVEERGLVERLPHPDDRRRRRVAITAAGEEAVAALPRLGREVAEAMTDGFSEAERAQLVELLERAASNLEARR